MVFRLKSVGAAFIFFQVRKNKKGCAILNDTPLTYAVFKYSPNYLCVTLIRPKHPKDCHCYALNQHHHR